MPRAIWSGSIVFGLVNVPARLYSAIEEHRLHFRMVHEPDGSPIGYQKVCKQEEKPVPDGEIVKAFEVEKGTWVYMEDEDFEAARVEGYRTIEIVDFVPYPQIDPIFFAKTYYCGPDRGAEQAYAVLVRALEASALAGIAKFVMRDRQYLGCLRVRDGVIALEQLYFADEIRPTDAIRPDRARVAKREVELAERLIESYTSDWQPAKYKDTYRDALCKVIKAKQAGKEVQRAPAADEEGPPDLMEALRRSLEARRGGAPPERRGGGLAKLSKSELEERAREADIPGRSKMSKNELVKALESAA